MQRRRVVIAAVGVAVLVLAGVARWRSRPGPLPRASGSAAELARGATRDPARPPPALQGDDRAGGVEGKAAGPGTPAGAHVRAERLPGAGPGAAPAGLSISGLVVDPQGVGVGGAKVTVVAVRASTEGGGMDAVAMSDGASGGDTTTDGAGRFEVSGLPPGEHDVVAAKEGRDGPKKPLRIQAGDLSVRIVLTKGGVLRGRVVVEGGGPLRNLSVDLLTRAVGFADADVPRELDPEGRFAIPIRRDGPHTLRVAADDCAPFERTVETTRGADQDVGEIVLTRGRDLAGVVVDAATLAPVAAAGVSWRGPDPRSRAGDATLTGADGTFVLHHVAGAAQLRVEHEGYAPARLTAAAATGAAQEPVVVRLGRGGVIAVRVLTTTGAPLAGVDVGIYTAGGTARSGKTDAEGGFEAAALAPGAYVVQAESETHNPGLAGRPVVLREGERATVELRERSAGTTLVLVLGGPGVAGDAPFQVALVPGDAPAGASASSLGSMTVVPIEPIGGQPRLTPTFQYLEPGRYTALIAKPDGEEMGLLLQPIEVGPGPHQAQAVDVPAELPRVTW